MIRVIDISAFENEDNLFEQIYQMLM